MPKRDEGLTQFPGFKGLRNNVPAEDFDLGDLEAAPNVHILDSHAIESRQGNSALKVTGARHSLFASGAIALVVAGTTLKRLLPDYSEVALRADMAAGRPVSYEAVAGRVYYTNGIQRGVVELDFTHRTWGLEVPALPLATAFPGSLPPGRYQFAVTYLRNDGQPSGALPAGAIDITGGGIQFTQIPVSTDATVTHKELWLSKCNDDTLYRYALLDAAATTAMAVEVKPGLIDLKTLHLGPPPDGDVIARYKGYMLVAAGDTLYPSEPYAYELFDRRKGIRVPGRIAVVACMTDGVHCGTDQVTGWLGGAGGGLIRGDSPQEFRWTEKADYGAMRGSLAFASGAQVGKGDADGAVAFWMSTQGTVCMGTDGGDFKDLTVERYAFPVGERAAGLVRRHRGMSQYIGVMHGVATAGNSFN